MSTPNANDKRSEFLDRAEDPAVADNKATRCAILRRVEAGELTMEQAHKELEDIIALAKKMGLPTLYEW